MRAFAMAVSCALVVSFASEADDGCSKDTDCKGERICVQRQCVDSASRPDSKPADAVPASFQPGSPGAAQPRDPSTGAPTAAPLNTWRRHFGAFIRPDLGFGYVYTSASSNGTDASIKGLAGSFGFAAGAAVSENNILA